MQTIRGRLTAWYSAALVLTLTAFAVALYVARRLEPDGPVLRYATHLVSGAGPRFGSLLVAADVRTAELAVAQLLSTLILIVPIGLVAAILVGSWIARSALEPVDRIISEVREITDGRSLHRRLAEPMDKDELGRLAETLNQMMTRLERSFAALRRL